MRVPIGLSTTHRPSCAVLTKIKVGPRFLHIHRSKSTETIFHCLRCECEIEVIPSGYNSNTADEKHIFKGNPLLVLSFNLLIARNKQVVWRNWLNSLPLGVSNRVCIQPLIFADCMRYFVRQSRSTQRIIAHTFITISQQIRSEEHTSELQSHSDLVCRLLLEKKKKPHT